MDKIKTSKTKTKKPESPTSNNGALSHFDTNGDWCKTIIQNSPDGFLLIKLPKGNILDFNASFCNMLGYSRDELLSMNIDDLEVGFDEASDTIGKRITDIEKTGGASFETHYKRKDGKAINVAVSISYLDEGFFFCFHRDITEQKIEQKNQQKEEALKETEERYRTLIELGNKIGEAVIMLQDTEGEEGVHTYASDQWPIITGYSKEELLSMSFFDLVKPEDRQLSIERHRQKMAGKAIPDLFEFTIIRKDGKETPVEITSAVTSYQGGSINVVYIRDITERKMAEKELKKYEQLYRALFDNAPVGISEVDFSRTKCIFNDLKRQGIKDFTKYFEKNPDKIAECSESAKTVYFNPALLKINETEDEEEYNNWKIEAAKTSNVFFETMKRLMIALAKGQTRLSRKSQIITLKGNVKNTQEHIIVAPGHEDTLSRVFIYHFDITNLVAEQTARLNEQIESRIELTRALVHELKTPLTAILSSSEMLSAELEDKELLALAKNINKSGLNLDKRINELLDTAKSEIGTLKIKRHILRPLSLIQQVVEQISPEIAKKKQSLNVLIPEDLPYIWGDKDRLKQVLFNLIGNAIKFNRKKGKISLRAYQAGASIVFEVSDEGKGIIQKDHDRIFQPYYRSQSDQERFSGLGLGLALSKSLVELHQGKIWVTSERGKGATFYFSIPIRKQ